MQIWDTEFIAFNWLGYPVSYIELIGTITGFLAVYLATKNNMITWVVGMINILCFSILFYQIHLYGDLILQVFYLVMNIYGWIRWSNVANPLQISDNNIKEKILIVVGIISLGFLSGYVFNNLHIWFPRIIKHPASYAYIDGLIMVGSMTATFLTTKRKIFNWILWLVLDTISVYIFIKKQVPLMAVEYFLFDILALYGWMNWRKQINNIQ